jgi:predicted phosphodiesterase
MRIALVSDIHGNLPALEAVLADMARARVDTVLNLGDLLAGPLWPAETCDRLMALGWPTIAGNHERQMLDPVLACRAASDRFAAERLEPRHRTWLAALPATHRFSDDVLMVHGTPTDDLRPLLETVDPAVPGSAIRPATLAEVQARLGDALAGVPGALVGCGHTHLPRTVQLDDGRLVVNPGSVGLPAFDDDHPRPYRVENGTPHARYAVVERQGTAWAVELRAVPYDHAAAARRAAGNGRADWADALSTGRVGRTEARAAGSAA